MKKKKICSIVIALCLFFVLSGCTNGNTESNKTGQGTGNGMNASQESNKPGTNTTTDNQTNNNINNNMTGTMETNDNTAGGSETGANGTDNRETGTNETGNHETNSTQTSETQAGNIISEKEAKQIALEKVQGAVESDIKDFHVENKRNYVEYEGKIIYNGKEYEFEIDGHDGTILEWEVEDIKE